MLDNFGPCIKNLREQKHLSLAKLSEISGIPIATINNYERGSEPSIQKADKLLNALGVSLIIGKK